MLVIPAIDLRNGKCVRLLHGEKEQETIYSDDPIATAKKWLEAGCNRLHVIDLDGAFSGHPKNLDWVIRIKEETDAFIQMGGGVRTLEAIDLILGTGVDRVILGTAVFEEAGLVQQAFEKYKERVMVALDVRAGMVAIRGWKDSSGFPLLEALALVEKLGGQEVIFTDIDRDGAMKGANTRAVKTVMGQTKLKVYASGGVTTLRDIQELKEIDSPGCIVGKAIYEGKLDLKEAIKIASSQS
jgi:phosphoribosylformimino-5-aminoimidazole carboxamide ribotide isomerase